MVFLAGLLDRWHCRKSCSRQGLSGEPPPNWQRNGAVAPCDESGGGSQLSSQVIDSVGLMPFSDVLVLAQFLDRLRLQLPDGIVNWLTPVWILCLGVAAGLVVCAAVWGVLKVLSLIPGLNSVGLRRESKYISIGVLTVAIFVAALVSVPSLIPQAPAAPAGAAEPAATPAASNVTRLLDAAWPLGGTLFASWLLATALVTLVGGNGLAETWIAVREGVLWPLCITAIVMTVLAVLGLFIVRKRQGLGDVS
jgi:hypothetical protein